MRELVIPLVFCVGFFGFAGSQKPAQVAPAYELYSWENPSGAWNFSLLYMTDRQKTPEEVLNKKTALHGIEQLKKAMSKLPRQSILEWFDRLTLKGVKLKGSEQLKYPPKEMISEVKRYAQAHAIKISGPGD